MSSQVSGPSSRQVRAPGRRNGAQNEDLLLLRNLVAEQLDLPPGLLDSNFDLDTDLEEIYGLDELDQAELVTQIEETFGVWFDEGDRYLNWNTLRTMFMDLQVQQLLRRTASR